MIYYKGIIVLCASLLFYVSNCLSQDCNRVFLGTDRTYDGYENDGSADVLDYRVYLRDNGSDCDDITKP